MNKQSGHGVKIILLMRYLKVFNFKIAIIYEWSLIKLIQYQFLHSSIFQTEFPHIFLIKTFIRSTKSCNLIHFVKLDVKKEQTGKYLEVMWKVNLSDFFLLHQKS